MITLYISSLLILILNALTIQRSKPLELAICVEMLALSTIISWFFYLNTSVVVSTLAISFWMMFFIILGATMALVLLSTILTSAPQALKMIS